MGWRNASNLRACSSICCCTSSMRSSPPTAVSAAPIAPGNGFDGVGQLRLRQPAHLRYRSRQGLKLFRERFDRVFCHVRLGLIRCSGPLNYGANAIAMRRVL